MKFARRGFLRGTGLAALVASGFLTNPGLARATARAKARGIAMTIGLNRISPSAYPDAPELRGCINDAKAINEIARFAGFECAEPLLNEHATAKAVIDGIQKAAEDLKSGDILLIQYAGHGSQIPDSNDDEADGQDETWCLYDRMLIDDELGRLWTHFAGGVRVLMISDSCHSGSVARGRGFVQAVNAGGGGARGDDGKKLIQDLGEDNPVFRYLPDNVVKAHYQRNRGLYAKISDELGDTTLDEEKIRASVLLISGCQDNQVAGDLSDNGLFTSKLLDVWADGKFNRGKFRPNYRSFHGEIVNRMPQTQTPNFYPIGEPNRAFLMQKPFTI